MNDEEIRLRQRAWDILKELDTVPSRDERHAVILRRLADAVRVGEAEGGVMLVGELLEKDGGVVLLGAGGAAVRLVPLTTDEAGAALGSSLPPGWRVFRPERAEVRPRLYAPHEPNAFERCRYCCGRIGTPKDHAECAAKCAARRAKSRAAGPRGGKASAEQ